MTPHLNPDGSDEGSQHNGFYAELTKIIIKYFLLSRALPIMSHLSAHCHEQDLNTERSKGIFVRKNLKKQHR